MQVRNKSSIIKVVKERSSIQILSIQDDIHDQDIMKTSYIPT